jgi:hypothetical protein
MQAIKQDDINTILQQDVNIFNLLNMIPKLSYEKQNIASDDDIIIIKYMVKLFSISFCENMIKYGAYFYKIIREITDKLINVIIDEIGSFNIDNIDVDIKNIINKFKILLYLNKFKYHKIYIQRELMEWNLNPYHFKYAKYDNIHYILIYAIISDLPIKMIGTGLYKKFVEDLQKMVLNIDALTQKEFDDNIEIKFYLLKYVYYQMVKDIIINNCTKDIINDNYTIKFDDILNKYDITLSNVQLMTYLVGSDFDIGLDGIKDEIKYFHTRIILNNVDISSNDLLQIKQCYYLRVNGESYKLIMHDENFEEKIKHSYYPNVDPVKGRARLTDNICYYSKCSKKFNSANELKKHLEVCKNGFIRNLHKSHEVLNLTIEDIINENMTQCPSFICDQSNRTFTPDELIEHFRSLGIKPFWYQGCKMPEHTHTEIYDEMILDIPFNGIEKQTKCLRCKKNNANIINLPCCHVILCDKCYEFEKNEKSSKYNNLQCATCRNIIKASMQSK